MTKAELIAALASLPDNHPVYVDHPTALSTIQRVEIHDNATAADFAVIVCEFEEDPE